MIVFKKDHYGFVTNCNLRVGKREEGQMQGSQLGGQQNFLDGDDGGLQWHSNGGGQSGLFWRQK